MIVTDIIDINKKKCKVYIDNEFAFALYKGELHSYHIYKEEEISSHNYELIMKELLPKSAVLRAMNLLKERSYTRMQLVQKLKENYYCGEHIEIAINYVKSYGYLDDFKYATDFIIYRASQLSKKQIELKLLQKGIEGNVIEQAFQAFCEDGNEIEEEKQIQSFLVKKKSLLIDEKQKQKIICTLLRKGFSMEKIRSVAREVEIEI